MALVIEEKHWYEVTSMRIGMGKIRIAHFDDPEELPEFLAFCHAKGTALMPYGAGTNCLGSDENHENLCLLVPAMQGEIVFDADGRVTIPAGIRLTRVATEAANHALHGLAPLAGIPGSTGGATKMNAGANGAQLSDFLEEVTLMDLRSGECRTWRKGDGGFGYRTSPFDEKTLILDVTLRLPKGDSPDTENMLLEAERERRRRVTPRGASAGSIFRNPPGDSAGRLLELAGCKGIWHGPLQVSKQHANWIVNLEGKPAATFDAIWLMAEMMRRVPGLKREVICL